MRALWVTPVLAAMLFTTGCGDLPSLEPLATDQNTVFDPAFLGSWNDGHGAVLVVQKMDQDPAYRVSWLDTDTIGRTPKVVHLEARLAQVGDQRILDLMAENPGAFSIPCHVFLKVTAVSDGLQVHFLDSKWIREKAMSSGTIPHIIQDKNPVITATTAQLNAFLLKYGQNELARDKPMMFRPLKQP